MSAANPLPPDPGPLLRPGETLEQAMRRGILTPRQRQEIVALAALVPIRPRMIIYREGMPEAHLYVCAEGVLKTYRDLPSGKRRVMTFRFPGDLFGLADEGRYVNTVQAVTPGNLYRIPLEPLRAKLRQDGELQFQVLSRVTHELREAQRQSIIIAHRAASGRIAMFLKMLQHHLAHSAPDTIPLPMSRSDIAAFLGLSLESVSRATSRLVKSGVIAFRHAREVQVLQPRRLDALAADL